MKIDIKLNDLIKNISDKEVCSLSNEDRVNIDELIDTFNSRVSDKFKKILYFIYNPDESDIVCKIVDGDIVVISGFEKLLSEVYLKNSKLNVIFENTKEEILSLFSEKEVSFLNDNKFKKVKNLINWSNVLENINKKQENTFKQMKEDNIKHKGFYVDGSNLYNLKIKDVDNFINFLLNNQITKSEFFARFILLEEILRYADIFDTLKKIINNENSQIDQIQMNFYKQQALKIFLNVNEDEDLKQDSNGNLDYIKKLYNKLIKNDFIEFAESVKLKVSKLLLKNNQKIDSLFYPKVIDIYDFLTDDVKSNVDIVKKIASKVNVDNNITINVENFSITDLVLLWKENRVYFSENDSFVSALNDKNKFIDFIVEIKKLNLESSRIWMEKLFNSFSDSIKNDIDVINVLIDHEHDFNYLKYLPEENYTNDFIDRVIEKGPVIYLSKKIKLSQTKKENIIKILEKDRGFREIPMRWTKPDILFSLSKARFNELNLCSDKTFDIEEFTNGSIENYKELVSRNSKFYNRSPSYIKENKEVFFEYLKVAQDFAYLEAPDKFRTNAKLVLESIKLCSSWGSLISPVLWSDGAFLSSYLDMCEDNNNENKEEMFKIIPKDIRDIFDKLDITHNYSAFILHHMLNKDLEVKNKKQNRLKI